MKKKNELMSYELGSVNNEKGTVSTSHLWGGEEQPSSSTQQHLQKNLFTTCMEQDYYLLMNCRET